MKYWRIKLQGITKDGTEIYWNGEYGWGSKDKALVLSKYHNYDVPSEGIEEAFYCCDNCGKELMSVADIETDYQFNEAMWIEFHGGYGMFIDNEGPLFQETKGILCYSCSKELMERYEWIKDLLSGINLVDAEAAWEQHMERLVEET